MNIIIIGDGAMGEALKQEAALKGINVLGVVGFCRKESQKSIFCVSGTADCVIDFSHADMLEEAADYCQKTQTPTVIATTNLTQKHKEIIDRLSKNAAVCQSGNFSAFMAVFKKIFAAALSLLPDCDVEILEMHHHNKADAPSGTAKDLQDIVLSFRPDTHFVFDRSSGGCRQKNQVGVASLRGGSVCGIHQAFFLGEDETLTITHTAQNKRIFACGALDAAKALQNRKAGLYDFCGLIEGRYDS